MEEGEYGLTRRTCFAARRLELVAVAGLLSISWCVLGTARFRVFLFGFVLLRTYTACCKYVMRPACLIYLSTSTGVRAGCHYLISLSVCLSVCMCNIRRFY